MKACQVCGGLFTPLQRRHLSCSPACKREQKLRNAAVWRHLNSKRVRDYDLAYKRERRVATSVKAKAEYASKTTPFAARALALASRMNLSQKTRFADWLLKVNHKANRQYAVDYFIADYNSEGI